MGITSNGWCAKYYRDQIARNLEFDEELGGEAVGGVGGRVKSGGEGLELGPE